MIDPIINKPYIGQNETPPVKNQIEKETKTIQSLNGQNQLNYQNMIAQGFNIPPPPDPGLSFEEFMGASTAWNKMISNITNPQSPLSDPQILPNRPKSAFDINK